MAVAATMSWFNVWDGLKNKTCRYLLQRYLGQFLDENLNLEQLNIELYNGKATIKNVSLRVDTLNELLEAQGWPLEFTGGHIGQLSLSVPWNALMTNDSSIEVADIELCIRPVRREHDGSSMIESMWSSVSSSLQLAEEYMRQEENDCDVSATPTIAIGGLEKFAETIDNVLNRIRAKFTNVTIKIEHPSVSSLKGIALKIHLDELIYKNETGNEKSASHTTDNLHTESADVLNRIPTYTKHNVIFTGAHLYTQELKPGPSLDLNQQDIPILKMLGEQHIQIKVKQSEDVTGPKIYFYIELGAICGICSPHQIHMLLEFLEAFTEDISNKKQMNARHSPEMINANESDAYEGTGGGGGMLSNNLSNAWVSTDDFPSTNTAAHMQTNTHLTYRNIHERYCESLASSSASSRSTLTSVSRCQRKPTNLDTSGEISNFVVKIASFVAIVLQEDIVVESASKYCENIWNERSLTEQAHVSEKFFNNIQDVEFDRDINESVLCDRNHILLRLHPVVAEGKQNRNKNIIQITTTVCVTQLDLCEILEGKVTHLLLFNQRRNSLNEYQYKPELSMHISSTNSVKLKNHSSTDVNIELAQCNLEFDISIIDRLGALLAPSPYSKQKQMISQLDDSEVAAPLNTKINLSCTKLDVNLRFPIVDLKPAHDTHRVPWWKQNIRTDFLLVAFEQLNVKYCNSQVQLNAAEINIYYCEDKQNKTHILNTRFKRTDQTAKEASIIEYPQLVVDINDIETVRERTKDEAPTLPFSSKRNCRQSSTSSYPKADSSDFTETILLPGEPHEMNDFCTKSMSASVIGVRINFPELSLFLESKQLFEIIYNRLNSDLFMWEPSSPYLTTSPLKDKQFMSMQSFGLMDSVYISAVSQNNPFDSMYEPRQKSQKSKNVIFGTHVYDNDTDDVEDEGMPTNDCSTTRAKKSQTHNCSVEIKVGHASASLFVPVRDVENHILPEVCGKFDLNVNSLKIFLLNGYCEDPSLAFFCLQVKDVEVYHGGIVPMDYPLRFVHTTTSTQIDDFMKSTFYKIPHGLTKGITVSSGDMVTVAIEIKKNLEQHLKRIKITAGLKNTTLRYVIPPSPSLFWLNQLMDFLDVMDYPIEGYVPYSVISEMQLHLTDCAIDFRPDNFPYRAVIELSYFSVSSNIISAMPGCNLRFILEECVLSVAPHDTERELPGNMVTYIDSHDLVPVLDFGLLEISLKFSEKTEKCPKFDLRCSLQDVHLRTCYDSGSAFAQLIGYIANNVAKDEELGDKNSLQSSLSSESDFFQTEPQCSDEAMNKHQERVNLLMAEAVRDGMDVLETSDSELTPKEDELKLFYFPDESSPQSRKNKDLKLARSSDEGMSGEPLASIKDEFGIIADKSIAIVDNKDHCSSEEDYCIIVGEEKVHNEFEDIKISDDPLRIVDNHFCLPTSHNDVLNAPPSFPVPDLRYTLCEMTVTWHLYGGHDFAQRSPDSGEKVTHADATPMSDAYRHGVSYANNQVRPAQGKKPKEKLTWKSNGGQERNHEVLVEIQLTKVRFSYEVYPPLASYASRQVFLVNELEIRDRLQSSEFNKFLYNANPNNFANRNMKHMVVVKSLHVRPNPEQSPAQECSLRISLSPLRLHIDQDTLEFITDFFTNFGKCCDSEQDNGAQESEKTKVPLPAPTLCNNETEIPDAVQDLRARRIVNENLSILIDDQIFDNSSLKESKPPSVTSETSASPTYFREIVFSPDISICFDYHGRRVELSKGPVAGLLMGLGQLQCSEIILRKIVYRRGILGFEKVFNFLCKEWLRDIKRNQLPKILSGVGPTYAFVQLFQGIYDLFWLPIEHYQKDGRIIRGLQLGAQSFSARTILAALEITSRLIQLLQFTAETAFDMVSPGPSVRQLKKSKRGNKRRTHRPKDIREGVVNAYQIVKDGINDSANNLIETAVAEHDQKGLTGAVGAVMRQVPQLVVCPAVLATQATTNILGGVKSSLVPESKIEAKKKWKDDNC